MNDFKPVPTPEELEKMIDEQHRAQPIPQEFAERISETFRTRPVTGEDINGNVVRGTLVDLGEYQPEAHTGTDIRAPRRTKTAEDREWLRRNKVKHHRKEFFFALILALVQAFIGVVASNSHLIWIVWVIGAGWALTAVHHGRQWWKARK